jgi:hypothetical protein
MLFLLAEDFGGIQIADAGQIFLPVHCPIPRLILWHSSIDALSNPTRWRR